MAAEAPPNPASPPPRAAAGAEPWTSFAAWAADELGVRLTFDGDAYRFQPRDAAEPAASESSIRRSWFRRRPAGDTAPEAPASEPLTAGTPADVLEELLRRLREREGPVHARPVEQPEAVHELADRLFGAYTLDEGGRAHLAGCQLEDVPLVRRTRLEFDEEGAPLVTHRFFDELGEELPPTRARELGVDRVAPLTHDPARLDAGRLGRMTQSAARMAGDGPVALETIVWAKRASGRLRFAFGDASVDAGFEGWARTITAPAVACPATGTKTFHLGTTDDGRIAAAEAIGVSVVTGRRWLLSELERCTATGGLAEPEHLGVCAATGEPVLKSELRPCVRCGLRVGPDSRGAASCDACGGATSVGEDDERLRAIVEKHPRLAKRKWRLAETPIAYVLVGGGWLKRRVVALDRESLDVLHAAEASRFSSVWRPVSV